MSLRESAAQYRGLTALRSATARSNSAFPFARAFRPRRAARDSERVSIARSRPAGQLARPADDVPWLSGRLVAVDSRALSCRTDNPMHNGIRPHRPRPGGDGRCRPPWRMRRRGCQSALQCGTAHRRAALCGGWRGCGAAKKATTSQPGSRLREQVLNSSRREANQKGKHPLYICNLA